MADNFLERRREEYEQRKALWLKKKRNMVAKKIVSIQKPEDEAL